MVGGVKCELRRPRVPCPFVPSRAYCSHALSRFDQLFSKLFSPVCPGAGKTPTPQAGSVSCSLGTRALY